MRFPQILFLAISVGPWAAELPQTADTLPSAATSPSSQRMQPENKGEIQKVRSRSVEIRMDSSSRTHRSERLRIRDSVGADIGWLQTSDLPVFAHHDDRFDAVIVSGRPEAGQSVETIPQLPISLEVFAGVSSPSKRDTAYGHFGKSNTTYLATAQGTLMGWYRTKAYFDFWCGLGLTLRTIEVEPLVEPRQTTLKREWGFPLAVHAGGIFYRRLGGFMEAGVEFYPHTVWGHITTVYRGGFSLSLTPGFSLEASVRRSGPFMEGDFPPTTTTGGISLVWTPARR